MSLSNNSRLDSWITRVLLGCVVVTLALVPFHAFLTVWGASLVGHYTALRLWKEALLGIAILAVIYVVIRRPAVRTLLLKTKLLWLIYGYTLLLLLLGAVAYARGTVNVTALLYGELVDLRFLGFFVVCLTAAEVSGMLRRWWPRLLLVPLTIVALFGLAQHYLLPYDFLKHFGYNTATTIPPYETIDHKLSYIRIESTLRGANPLGAYLITPIVALIAGFKRKPQARLLLAGLLLAALLTLLFSYSRSAWIGTAVSVAVLLWLLLRSRRAKQWLGVGAVILVLVAAGSFLALRHNDQFENTFFHTDEHSQSYESSNAGHAAALEKGARDIVQQPLGRGPGTAGPASLYNTAPARIAENYFIQIGQEAGIIGLLAFVAINVVVARRLYRRRDTLCLVLFASLIGISLVNLLWHAWTDDTLAYLWWGLAGIALARAPERS